MAVNYDPTIGGMALPINIIRGNPVPLDKSSLYPSMDDAINYATTDPTAYVGQIIVVIEDEEPHAYIIANADGELEEIGSGSGNGTLFFNTKQEAIDFISEDPDSFVGRLIVIMEDGAPHMYIVKDADCTLEEIAGNSTGLVFSSKDAALNYTTTNPKSYVGQIIVVADENSTKAYVVKDKFGEIEEIGKSSIGIVADAYLNVTKSGRIATLTATDRAGTTTVTVTDGRNGEDGIDGITPYIDSDGYWVVGNVTTNIPARGDKGERGEGFKIENVYPTIADRDADAENIDVGQMVVVTDGGRLFLKTDDGWVEIGDFSSMTTIKGDAGEKGEAGSTPIPTKEADGNYYWYIDGVSTGVKATGPKGETGEDGYAPTVSHRTVDGLTTYTTTYKDGNILKTDEFYVNNGYTDIKTTQNTDTGWYSDSNYSITEYTYLDENGVKRNKELKVYNGKTPTIKLGNKDANGITPVYLNGHYDPDWQYEDKAEIYDGLSSKLEMTKLADDAHRFTYTNYKRNSDGSVVEDTDNSGYVDINTGYCPTINVTKPKDNLAEIEITDLNATHNIELSSAEISVGEKENGHVDITVKDGVHGEKTVRLYDAENAYDDSDVLKRLANLEDAHIVVSALPNASQGKPGKIYLVPVDDPDSNDKYEEYVLINNAWEKIGGSSKGSGVLTNDIVTNVEVGGIKSNTTFVKGTSLEDIVRTMLVMSYDPRAILSLSSDSIYFTGDKIYNTVITANVVKGTDPIHKIVFIADGQIIKTYDQGVENGGTYSETWPQINSTAGYPSTVTFTVRVVTTNGKIVNENTYIKFINPSYFGIVSDSLTNPTADDITSLTKLKQTGKSYTGSDINMAYGKILYAYPKSYGALTSIKDANNIQYINSYTRTEITINNVDMYCYLLKDAAGVSNFTQIYS